VGYADQVFDLTGKVVVVTGGSRGLGKEIAFAVARLGADVVIASRKAANCEEVAKQLAAQTGRASMAYGVHVGRWDELEPFVDAVYERFGRVDVLFNNAGMSPVYDKLTDVTEKLFDSVMNVNFKGPFRLAALIGERMRAAAKGDGEAGGGSIINVSSAGSIRPRGQIVPYAGAKAALNAMTEGLAEGLGPAVRGEHPDARHVHDRHREGLGPGRGDPGPKEGDRAAARGDAPRDHRRRAVPGLGRLQLHERLDCPGRRRHAVTPLSEYIPARRAAAESELLGGVSEG
jgi:NAD(P)-dependent dehydrogenase (short-subunit alcohol dehydrogenase family)